MGINVKRLKTIREEFEMPVPIEGDTGTEMAKAIAIFTVPTKATIKRLQDLWAPTLKRTIELLDKGDSDGDARSPDEMQKDQDELASNAEEIKIIVHNHCIGLGGFDQETGEVDQNGKPILEAIPEGDALVLLSAEDDTGHAFLYGYVEAAFYAATKKLSARSSSKSLGEKSTIEEPTQATD